MGGAVDLAIWVHRTKTGRVVYARKVHGFSQRDVERIVRKFIEEAETEPLMMSQIADRVLFWVGRRIGIFDFLEWSLPAVDRIFKQNRGELEEPQIVEPRRLPGPGSYPRFFPVLPSVSDVEEGKVEEERRDPKTQLRDLCETMIQWLDENPPPQ